MHKVTAFYGETMPYLKLHSLERQLVEALESGQEIHLSDLGGLSAIQDAAHIIDHSPLIPEFLRLLIESSQSKGNITSDSCFKLAIHFVDMIKDPLILNETVEIIHSCRPFLENWEKRFFQSFLFIAFDLSNLSLTRTFALDGAFRFVGDRLGLRYELLAKLVVLSDDDDPEFLRHASKIMGIAYSLWRSEGMTERLEAMLRLDSFAKNEVAFELGMAALVESLDATEYDIIMSKMHDARQYFDLAIQIHGHRPDAELFSSVIKAIDAFSGDTTAEDVSALNLQISEAAFETRAWHHDLDEPSWLGARFSEMASWQLLSIRLSSCANRVQEPSWLDAVTVIEQELIPIITASRSILHRKSDGGLEVIVRPRLKGALKRKHGQIHVLKRWLEINQNHPEASSIAEMLNDSEFSRCANSFNAASGKASTCPEGSHTVKAFTTLFEIHESSSSPHIEPILERCNAELSQLDDYKIPDVKKSFNAVLLLTLRYLFSRADLTRKNAPYTGFLHSIGDNEDPPKEEALQNDYFQFMIGALGASSALHIELADIASGRADIAFSFNRIRFVAEVKRELSDASFDALLDAYSGQALEYQNTNIRIGFLLVLDLTDKNQGTAHVVDQVRPFLIQRPNESSKRGVVVVKISGNKPLPSEIQHNRNLKSGLK